MGLIHTDATTLTKVQGSAVGIQPKCYDNGYWYKKNVYGCEDQSEHLASLVLMHSNITNYVFYTTCTIDDVPGCVSRNFLLDNESFLSFHRLHELASKIRFANGCGLNCYDFIECSQESR